MTVCVTASRKAGIVLLFLIKIYRGLSLDFKGPVCNISKGSVSMKGIRNADVLLS